MGVGITVVSGPVRVDEARTVLMGMQDHDILFWDEFHSAVAGSKTRADWTLPFLTDGDLVTARGAEKMPDVTVIAATTDAGKLPQTILSRFMVKPTLTNYTETEAVEIVDRLGARMLVPIAEEELLPIAKAANFNPRDMRKILTAVRDVAFTPSGYTFEKALRWAGFSHDGLDQVARDIMLLLLDAKDCTMGLETLSAHLGEPGPLRHHEQILLQKGYLTIEGRGRKLTDDGILRAVMLIEQSR
jgi:Holliday junction DNA helicase RuvB